jgi:anti-sigma28 factor (negative regulator of flagellin synthesis)
VTLAGPAASVPVPPADRFARRHSGHAEPPGPDGIRHDLVARVRAEIAAGTYDTEAKWLAAEEALLRAVAG